MKIFNYRDVRAENAEEESRGLNVRWLITRETGAENFAMRLFEMAPNGFSPLHSHPWEHEVFILEGNGAVTNGKEEKEFKEGDVIFIPSNERHQLKNAGKVIVKFLCLIPHENEL
jgi:quercetin dioxygenase-like cupin family protein